MSAPDPNRTPTPTERPRELTVAAVILGIMLSIVMGAANVYLGLRAGMTVSASIPAAVIAMGLLRGVLGRKSILESNLVQTAASAGESLAAGIIFTMPALLLTGVWQQFNFWITSLIALAGGLLGILLMIPMRRVFVVDNRELMYPEGLACAEVLRAGESDAQGAQGVGAGGFQTVIMGIAIGAIFKFAERLLGLLSGTAQWATLQSSRVYYFGADISPALLSVGYIVTLPIAVQIFAGGAIGWLVAIPLMGTQDLEAASAVDKAFELWSEKVRYMGVGTMIVGGVISIWKVRGGLVAAMRELGGMMRETDSDTAPDHGNRNLAGGTILILTLVCVALVAGLYYRLLDGAIGLTVTTTIIMLVMSFFFAAVASYIVGLVGNSNSPVSGMTITAVLVTGVIISLFGFAGEAGIVATLGVAGIVCCVACTSGDVCNDLKTGNLVGASPRSQQIMQVIGVLVAAFVMAPVLTILHEGSLKAGGGGIGTGDLPAPQANLFAELAKGFFDPDGKLPRDMVYWGVAIGGLLIVGDYALQAMGSRFRLHVMPVAVGIYLPFGLSVPILFGGLVRSLVDAMDRPGREDNAQRGVLMTSGIIAGESLVGVLIGFLLYVGYQELSLGSRLFSDDTLQLISLAALLATAAWVYFWSVKRRGD